MGEGEVANFLRWSACDGVVWKGLYGSGIATEYDFWRRKKRHVMAKFLYVLRIGRVKVQPFGKSLNARHRAASSMRMIFVSGVGATRRRWIEIVLMMMMRVRLQQCDGSRSGQFKEL